MAASFASVERRAAPPAATGATGAGGGWLVAGGHTGSSATEGAARARSSRACCSAQRIQARVVTSGRSPDGARFACGMRCSTHVGPTSVDGSRTLQWVRAGIRRGCGPCELRGRCVIGDPLSARVRQPGGR